MTLAIRTQRWTPVCLDCWQVGTPDQYAPVATGWNQCAVCGFDAMTVNVAPETLRAIGRAVAAKPCEYCGEVDCTK